MREETHHVLLWGALRFILGVAQLTLAPFGVYAVLTVGPGHWVTWALFTGATGAMIVSRCLFHGRPDPKLRRRDGPPTD
jgi:hypothetical protein